MKNLLLFSTILFTTLCAKADLLKTATLNMQGWIDSSNSRAVKLNQIFKSQGIMKDVSFLMVQESMEYKTYSTASQLATAMGWKSFSHRRTSDSEGLGFIYPPETQIQSIDVYQIQARYSESDYSRMALSAQVKHKTLGLVRYVNTHLAHKSNMSSTRKRQITEILTWLKKLEEKSPSRLIIFGGDFNTGVSHSAYAGEFDLITESSFRFRRSPSEGSSYTWIEDDGSARSLIDYFFLAQLSSSLNVNGYKTRIYTQTTEQDISDHNFLVMTVDASVKP